MPTYDYRCPTCDVTFEANRSIDERESASCPTCKTDSPKQLSATTAFALKGSGWSADGFSRHPTGDDLRAGRVKPKDLKDIPVVGADGKLRDTKTGKVLAG